MKILVIGDIHLKEHLGYSDYIPDGRVGEKKQILDFIVEKGKECDSIVFLGDQFHLKNNPSEVIREFIEFVERFENKKIYILAGNHEKLGDGKSAIDFMKEVNKPNWHIITNSIKSYDNMVFCPFFYKGELKCKNNRTASTKLNKALLEMDGNILFAHHAISDMSFNGMETNSLQEPILSKKQIEKKYHTIFVGHIHVPSINKRTIVAGSIFNNEMGEDGKKIYTLDTKDDKIEIIDLPGRKIIKMENPTEEDVQMLTKGEIVKIIFTKQVKRNVILRLMEILPTVCEAYLIVEKYRNEREKSHLDDVVGMPIEELLRIYAKDKKVDEQKLIRGFEMIR